MEQLSSTAKPTLVRIPTGIVGFDEITGGGLPRDRNSLVVGGPGTGKTVFCLQVLANNARDRNISGIFAAFEENSDQIIANASSFGWALDNLVQQNKLYFIDAHLTADVVHNGNFDLTGMLASIEAKAKEMDAKLVVFDSLDLLLSILNDRIAERRECYRLRDWLRNSGLTGILTARDDSSVVTSLLTEFYSFAEATTFMADCVVELKQRLVERVATRNLHVVKFRGAQFDENEYPFVISSDGIDVASHTPEEPEQRVPVERVSCGIESLDALLGGGYFRGASTLITGAPGTAKSTLAGAFAEAACMRGESTLYVSFDQKASALVRSLKSVAIDLAPHVASGTLVMYAGHTAVCKVEEHLVRLIKLMRRHNSRCLVIDPLSAPFRTEGLVAGFSVAEQLMHFAWLRGITVVCTSLARGTEPLHEGSVAQISSIADTWIHLSYLVQTGEYNRELTVIKSRGTRHAKNVHELILSDDGVKVADVYTAGGEVLMGSMRHDIESAVERKQDLMLELESRRKELARLMTDQYALEEKLAALQRNLNTVLVGDKGPAI
ncbi:MAG TPA: circadian clock protein KaiC [Paucimonas sp.]|nr:circadian clock protein KaiC [Paucimonas sp.]